MRARSLEKRPFAVDLSKGGKTKQSFTAQCDVNTIVKRWEATGAPSHVARGEPHYGDYSNVTDYQTAVRAVHGAEAMFAALPAKLRDRMGNNPAEFIRFVGDPANADELVELGLAVAKEEKKQPEAAVVETPPVVAVEPPKPDST